MVVATLTVRAVGIWGQDRPTRFWQIVSVRGGGGVNYAHHINIRPPPSGFSDLPTVLTAIETKWRDQVEVVPPSIYTTALHCVDLICFIRPFIHIVITANRELELCFESGPIQPQNALLSFQHFQFANHMRQDKISPFFMLGAPEQTCFSRYINPIPINYAHWLGLARVYILGVAFEE